MNGFDLTSLFPQTDDPARLDMASAFLQNGMGQVQGSRSPLLQFMAPLAGAAMGGNIQQRKTDIKTQMNDQVTDQLLGAMSGNPQAAQYVEILANPDVSDDLKGIAQTMLAQAMKPKPQGRRARTGVVNDKLVNMDTGQIIADFASPTMDNAAFLDALNGSGGDAQGDPMQTLEALMLGNLSASQRDIVEGRMDRLVDASGEPETTTRFRGLHEQAIGAGLEPGSEAYQAFMLEGGKGPMVEVHTGDQVDPRPLTDKPPKGFQRRWDPVAGTWVDEAIPGSDPDADRTSADRASQIAMADYQRKFDIVDGSIDSALGMLEEHGRKVAGFGSLLSSVPESAARDFQAVLDNVKANLGFEELQAMRDTSPTGGALGQVTEREIAFLQAIQGNLDAAQSPGQLADVLRDIQQRRREFSAERARIMNGAGGSAATTGPSQGTTAGGLNWSVVE